MYRGKRKDKIWPAMLVKILPLAKISAIRYEYFETKAGFFASLCKSQLQQVLQFLCKLIKSHKVLEPVQWQIQKME